MDVKTQLVAATACLEIAALMLALKPPKISQEAWNNLDVVARDFLREIEQHVPEIPKIGD